MVVVVVVVVVVLVVIHAFGEGGEQSQLPLYPHPRQSPSLPSV